MRSSRDHDILERLLETRVIILEISSRFAVDRLWTSAGCGRAHMVLDHVSQPRDF
jgi:hypothetical protein